jgi:hypothetical protein
MKKLLKNPLFHCAVLLAAAAMVTVLKSQVSHKSTLTREPHAPHQPSHYPSGSPAGIHPDSFHASQPLNEKTDRFSSYPGVPILSGKIPSAEFSPAADDTNAPRASSPQISTESPRISRHRPKSDRLKRETAISPSSQLPGIVFPVMMEEARMPVATTLRDIDFAEFTLLEQSTIRGLQDHFTNTIAAASSQDPDSPAYFNYWKSAACLHDEQLRITLGWESFNRLSALAAQAAERAR